MSPDKLEKLKLEKKVPSKEDQPTTKLDSNPEFKNNYVDTPKKQNAI